MTKYRVTGKLVFRDLRVVDVDKEIVAIDNDAAIFRAVVEVPRDYNLTWEDVKQWQEGPTVKEVIEK